MHQNLQKKLKQFVCFYNHHKENRNACTSKREQTRVLGGRAISLVFCLVSSLPSLFYLLTLQTEACRKVRKLRPVKSGLFDVCEPDIVHSSATDSRTSWQVMGSTTKFFQDQQLDKQNLCQFMTSDTWCVLYSTLN